MSISLFRIVLIAGVAGVCLNASNHVRVSDARGSDSVSAAKPTPKWVKFIDQGENDKRLKGYRTPEGVKVEIVADEFTCTVPHTGDAIVTKWRFTGPPPR